MAALVGFVWEMRSCGPAVCFDDDDDDDDDLVFVLFKLVLRLKLAVQRV